MCQSCRYGAPRLRATRKVSAMLHRVELPKGARVADGLALASTLAAFALVYFLS